MSDLQDALDLHDEWMTGVSWNPNDPHSQAILVIVEAARKYANPDDIIAEVRRRVPFEFDSLLLWKPMRDVLLSVTEDAHKHDWVDSILGDGQVCQVGDCGAFQSGVTEAPDG